MAEKKNDIVKTENALVKDLAEVKWLNNPVIYSQVAGNFTLSQQKIMVGVLMQLQDRINESIEQKRNSGSFGPLFDLANKDEGDTLEMFVDPRSIGVTPDHYGDLEEAINFLGRQTMKYPVFDSKGRVKKYVVASLFSRIEMPPGNIRRTGKVRMVMLKENLNDFFDPTHGYVTHVARITQICTKKRTPRIYIYLSRYRDIGHKAVPYKDLCEFLGLTDEYYAEGKNLRDIDGKKEYYDEKSKKWKPYCNPFDKFSKVKAQVLNPSQKEMDELCEKGEIDFQFEFEPVYEYDRKKGNPSAIIFTINKGPLGKYRDQILKRSGNERKVIGYLLKHCPDLKSTDIVPIVKCVEPEKWEAFSNFVYKEIFAKVEKTQPDDVAAYILIMMRGWATEVEKKDVQTNATEPQKSKYVIETQEEKNERIWKSFLLHYKGKGRDVLARMRYVGITPQKQIVLGCTTDDADAFDSIIATMGIEEKRELVKTWSKHTGVRITGMTYNC